VRGAAACLGLGPWLFIKGQKGAQERPRSPPTPPATPPPLPLALRPLSTVHSASPSGLDQGGGKGSVSTVQCVRERRPPDDGWSLTDKGGVSKRFSAEASRQGSGVKRCVTQYNNTWVTIHAVGRCMHLARMERAGFSPSARP
jgi:hypothetical protein